VTRHFENFENTYLENGKLENRKNWKIDIWKIKKIFNMVWSRGVFQHLVNAKIAFKINIMAESVWPSWKKN